jgi:hypothetical protein
MGHSLILHELKKERTIHHNLHAGAQADGNFILIPCAKTQSDALPREAAIALRDVDKWQILVVA